MKSVQAVQPGITVQSVADAVAASATAANRTRMTLRMVVCC
jgi:hypothetical protein